MPLPILRVVLPGSLGISVKLPGRVSTRFFLNTVPVWALLVRHYHLFSGPHDDPSKTNSRLVHTTFDRHFEGLLQGESQSPRLPSFIWKTGFFVDRYWLMIGQCLSSSTDSFKRNVPDKLDRRPGTTLRSEVECSNDDWERTVMLLVRLITSLESLKAWDSTSFRGLTNVHVRNRVGTLVFVAEDTKGPSTVCRSSLPGHSHPVTLDALRFP